MATNEHLLKMLCEEQPGYHPLIAMLRIAKDPNSDPKLRFDCHKEIAQYVEPKLKTVEHKGSVKQDFGVLRVVAAPAPKAQLEKKTDGDVTITQSLPKGVVGID